MINCAIIGFGKMGQIRYQEILKNQNINIKYIYDPNFNNDKVKNISKKLIISDFKKIDFKSISTVFICSLNSHYFITKNFF